MAADERRAKIDAVARVLRRELDENGGIGRYVVDEELRRIAARILDEALPPDGLRERRDRDGEA